jgi:hypothetical protein
MGRPRPHTAPPGRKRGPKPAEGPREPAGRLQRPRKEPDRPQKPHIDVTDEIMREILERMSDGELLKDICDEDAFPTTRAVNQFCWRNPLWHDAFDQAKLRQQDARLDIAAQVITDRSRDWDANGNPQYHVVQRDKAIVDTILKIAVLTNPAKYGTSRSETKIVGDAARPVVIRTLTHPQAPRWLREAEQELGLPVLEGAPNAERLRNLLLTEQPLTPEAYEIAASQREEENDG